MFVEWEALRSSPVETMQRVATFIGGLAAPNEVWTDRTLDSQMTTKAVKCEYNEDVPHNCILLDPDMYQLNSAVGVLSFKTNTAVQLMETDLYRNARTDFLALFGQ